MPTAITTRGDASVRIGASMLVFASACLLQVVFAADPAQAITFEDQQIHVIDHNDYVDEYITVRNRSAFFFQDGGVAFALTVEDGSGGAWLDFSGGLLRQSLRLWGSTEANISGGTITGSVYALNAPTYWSGGAIGGPIHAMRHGEFYVFGSGFAVDGVPVGYGALISMSGTLTGTLNSGESIIVDFRQGETYSGSNTGTIILVDGEPTPSPPPDYSDQIALFDDGGSHVIDHADFLDLPFGVSVRSPAAATTVDVLEGAQIGGTIQFSGPSVVNMFGGDTATMVSDELALNAEDGTFNLFGGTLAGRAITLSASLNLWGGTIGAIEVTHGTSLVLAGGTVAGDLYCTGRDETSGDSVIDMSGGHVLGHLGVYESCRMRLSGGTVDGDIYVSRGQLEIVGTGFAIDGVPAPAGPVPQDGGILTGTLQSGDPIDNFFFVYLPGIRGELILVPEPSLWMQQGAAVASLFILDSRRRRRRLSVLNIGPSRNH